MGLSLVCYIPISQPLSVPPSTLQERAVNLMIDRNTLFCFVVGLAISFVLLCGKGCDLSSPRHTSNLKLKYYNSTHLGFCKSNRMIQERPQAFLIREPRKFPESIAGTLGNHLRDEILLVPVGEFLVLLWLNIARLSCECEIDHSTLPAFHNKERKTQMGKK